MRGQGEQNHLGRSEVAGELMARQYMAPDGSWLDEQDSTREYMGIQGGWVNEPANSGGGGGGGPSVVPFNPPMQGGMKNMQSGFQG